jgi:hypothetical protein
MSLGRSVLDKMASASGQFKLASVLAIAPDNHESLAVVPTARNRRHIGDNNKYTDDIYRL